MTKADPMTLSVQVQEDRASRLLELQSRVRTATGPDRDLDIRLWALGARREIVPLDPNHRQDGLNCRAIDPPHDACFIAFGNAGPYAQSVTSSIDAALGLVERVLPGQWQWSRILDNAMSDMFVAYYDDETDKTPHPSLSRLPLAILNALLSALIAQSEASLRAVPTKPES